MFELCLFYVVDVEKIVLFMIKKYFDFSAFTIFIEAEITNKTFFPHFAFTFSPPYAIQKIKFAWPKLANDILGVK